MFACLERTRPVAASQSRSLELNHLHNKATQRPDKEEGLPALQNPVQNPPPGPDTCRSRSSPTPRSTVARTFTWTMLFLTKRWRKSPRFHGFSCVSLQPLRSGSSGKSARPASTQPSSRVKPRERDHKCHLSRLSLSQCLSHTHTHTHSVQ